MVPTAPPEIEPLPPSASIPGTPLPFGRPEGPTTPASSVPPLPIREPLYGGGRLAEMVPEEEGFDTGYGVGPAEGIFTNPAEGGTSEPIIDSAQYSPGLEFGVARPEEDMMRRSRIMQDIILALMERNQAGAPRPIPPLRFR